MSDEWRAQVCAEARTWLNTPYVPKGRVKGVGTDCGGILYQLYNPIFGPFAAFPQDYSADWAAHGHDGERYLDFIKPYVHEVREVLPGGFSLFHLGLRYAHAAIYLGDGKYIHAWGRLRNGGVTITPRRVLEHMAGTQPHPTKHFDPNPK